MAIRKPKTSERRSVSAQGSLLPVERVWRDILLLRGHRVLLDTQLAEIYAVRTKRLNEQVKRNRNRFPADFMFHLTTAERDEVVAECDHLKKLRFSPTLPYAFTEHGAVMLASVLNSAVAVSASIQVVRAFVQLRQMLSANDVLRRKIAKLERRYDQQFAVVFDAIRELMDGDDDAAEKCDRIGCETERTRSQALPGSSSARK